MVVLLPSGAENVKAILNQDGVTVIIKYTWPPTLYNIQDLFKKQLASKTFHAYHPMVLCYKRGLEKVRKRIDEAPESEIKVTLPMRVQTSDISWKKWGITRDDGTQVFCGEFTGHMHEYVQKVSNDVVVFDR